MKRVKQLVLAIMASMSCALMGMMSPEEIAQKRVASYLEEQKGLGTPEERAFRAIQQYKVTPEERAAVAVEARLALQELQDDPSNNSVTILADVKRETDTAVQAEALAKENATKWENTLLTPVEWRVGWYNRDFVEAGFIGAGILAAVMLYQQLLKRRTDIVIQLLNRHYY